MVVPTILPAADVPLQLVAGRPPLFTGGLFVCVAS